MEILEVIKIWCRDTCTIENKLTDDREGFFTFGGSPKISKLFETSYQHIIIYQWLENS